MEASTAVRRVVVIGRDGGSVGQAVRSRRGPGVAVAGLVGDDEQTARRMADEMLGGVDEVVAPGSE
jgi:hypothetical protein